MNCKILKDVDDADGNNWRVVFVFEREVPVWVKQAFTDYCILSWGAPSNALAIP